MIAVVELLQGLVAQGELLTCAGEAGFEDLQEWLDRRSQVFCQMNLAELDLGADERSAARALLERLLKLDKAILFCLEPRLNDTGHELAATRRVRQFLDSNGTSTRPAFLQRAV